MRVKLSGVRVESTLARIVNARGKAASDHARDNVQTARELARWIGYSRFLFARDRQNFVRAQLGIESGALQKIQRAQVALGRSRQRSN